jgi:integrase
MIYLGEANSPRSLQRYRRVVGEWLATGRVPQRRGEPGRAMGLSVSQLVDRYLGWARSYYLTVDGPSPGLGPVQATAGLLKELYGDTSAAEFGPVPLKTVRLAMIERGLCRNVINQRVACTKRIFRWAVAEELVHPAVLQALSAVEPLRVGRSAARESERVRPVPDEHVEAVLPFLPPTVRAMVRLQRLTGMRSGEVCVLRSCDVDTSGPVWVYRPAGHKTAYRGHERAVRLGPKAQAVLNPFLRSDSPQRYVFSPRRALRERTEMARGRQVESGSVSPVPASRLDVSSDRYRPRSYNRALHYAMKRATRAGRLAEENFWHPHQLRHRHATEVRQARGLEAARVLLGHRSISQTLEYAEADAALAASLAADLG